MPRRGRGPEFKVLDLDVEGTQGKLLHQSRRKTGLGLCGKQLMRAGRPAPFGHVANVRSQREPAILLASHSIELIIVQLISRSTFAGGFSTYFLAFI